MTDQELSELLSHPRVRAFMERVAEEAATRAYAQLSKRIKARVGPGAKPAAKGDLNYRDAAEFIGCPAGSMRGYACTGAIERGKLPGTVTLKSCIRFKSKYTPRPNGRIPRANIPSPNKP